MPRRNFNAKTADSQQRLPRRLAAAQSINFEFAGEWIEFAVDEAVRPAPSRADGLLEKSNRAATVGAAEEDDFAGGEVVWSDGRARQSIRRGSWQA